MKLVKSDGTDFENVVSNTVGSVKNLLQSMFSSQSVSSNGKAVTLHDTIITRLTLKSL
jgi:flagellar hook-basal body complex protein FliE